MSKNNSSNNDKNGTCNGSSSCCSKEDDDLNHDEEDTTTTTTKNSDSHGNDNDPKALATSSPQLKESSENDVESQNINDQDNDKKEEEDEGEKRNGEMTTTARGIVNRDLSKLEEEIANKPFSLSETTRTDESTTTTRPATDMVQCHDMKDALLQDIMPLPKSPSNDDYSNQPELLQQIKRMRPRDRESLERAMLEASQRGEGNVGAFATTNAPIPSLIMRNSNETVVADQELSQAEEQEQEQHQESLSNYQTEDEGLVQAHAVDHDDDVEGPHDDNIMEIATMISEQPSQQSSPIQDTNSRRLLVFLCFFIVATVIVVSVAVAVLVSGKIDTQTIIQSVPPVSSSSSQQPTLAPTSLVVSLPNFTLDAILNNNSSPQALAFNWLSQDPNLSQQTQGQRIQRMALATFYFSTKGHDWTVNHDWLHYNKHECNWFSKVNATSGGTAVDFIFEQEHRPASSSIISGVGSPVFEHEQEPASSEHRLGKTACDNHGNYISLVLAANKVNGPLPPEMGLLSHLELLDLTNNPLQGSLPSTLGLLTKLMELNLGPRINVENMGSTNVSHNNMGPMNVSNLGSDIDINLGPQIDSNIRPTVIGSKEDLLIGTIPSWLGLMTGLKYVYIFRTDLTGTLPSELGNWQQIKQFMVTRSKLSGTIPTELYQWTQLQHLHMFDNQLSGSLSSMIANLANLQALGLAQNQLTGQLPNQLWSLSNLAHVDFWGNNRLSGTIDTKIGLLTNLEKFNLRDTSMYGTIPSELGLCTKLMELDLHNMKEIHGLVPTQVFQLSALRTLNLGNNPGLTGSINSELGLATDLMSLALGKCNFSGSLPDDLAAITNLKILELQNNPLLSGTLPFIEFDARLVSVMLSNTGLNGTIPDAACGAFFLSFDCPAICGCDCACT